MQNLAELSKSLSKINKRNINKTMIDYLGILIKKYGGILIAGIAGAIIRRIRESMTIIEFLQVLFLGIFVSYCTGIVVEEYLSISENFKYVIGAISAIYSKELLDEIKETIKGISDTVKNWFNKKIE